MVYVSPYADPNAHGTLADSVTFRRHRCHVIMQKKPRRTKVKTPGQITQRNKFLAASEAYRQATPETKFCYNKRGIMLNKQGRNLFMRAQLINRVPSVTPGYPMHSLENMVVYYPVGTYAEAIEISLEKPFVPYGVIFWNKLEGQISGQIPSEIGPPGLITGAPHFEPVKFNNGVGYFSYPNSQDVKFPDAVTAGVGNQFCIEWWMRPTFASTVTFNEWIMGIEGSGGELGIDIEFRGSPNPFIYIRLRGSGNLSFPITFAANEVFHLLVVFDRELTDQTRIQLYLNGILITPSAGSCSTWTRNNPMMPRFWSAYKGTHVKYIDNMKIEDNTRSETIARIIADMNTEGSPIDILYGSVYDANNIFTQGTPPFSDSVTRVKIQNNTGDIQKIPYYYLVAIHWFREPDWYGSTVLRLPELELPPMSIIYLYITSDFSVYWDEALTQLACTNRISPPQVTA